MVEKFDVIVIGAGQAGLAMGYHLSKHKKKYVILEKADSIVSAWPCSTAGRRIVS